MTIPEGIKRARILRGITQQQLADRSGFSVTAIAHWETGTRDPKGSSLQKIADSLSVSVDYLTGVSDDPTVINEKSSPRLLMIEDIMTMPEKDFERLMKYYEFIKSEMKTNEKEKE